MMVLSYNTSTWVAGAEENGDFKVSLYYQDPVLKAGFNRVSAQIYSILQTKKYKVVWTENISYFKNWVHISHLRHSLFSLKIN
jgi:hypothetical protein